MKKKVLVVIAVIAAAVAAALYYYFLSPEEHPYLMLQCPLKYFLGLDCGICGAQRALHAALNGEFAKAVSYNPFLVLTFPYPLLVIYSMVFKNRLAVWLYKIVCNDYVFTAYFALLAIWGVVRNFL